MGEVYIHPLTPEEFAEVKHAVASLIYVLPPGDDERGRARALLLSAQEKLDRHWCAWCPVDVCDLSAVAHNAVVNYGTGRERKKMGALARAVNEYRPALDAHFAAIKPRPPERAKEGT